MNRRRVIGALVGAPALAACRTETPSAPAPEPKKTMPSAVTGIEPLGFPWKTLDPFLFCVHHDDAYPAGNERLGPAASLAGRNIGSDFGRKDGWSMYHGDVVPGFPQHPHRGFETVTIVRRGLVDHADSLGAAARYGRGDVQWLTAGKGIVHAEMFPLLDRGAPNPLELFQIWLNLPSTDKLAEPHFSMFWSRDIPRHSVRDSAGKATELVAIAGTFADKPALPPPPKSWAARGDSHVAIWTLKMEKSARFTLPATFEGLNRTLYFFAGTGMTVSGQAIPPKHAIFLRPDVDAVIENGAEEAELLLLQGRPIGEPVVQHGPFVMNSPVQIQQAFLDYRRTGFGGWPWPSDGPVHGEDGGRFARHADGRIERAT